MGKTALKSLLSMVGEAEMTSPIAQSFLNSLIQSIEKTANKNAYLPSAHYKPSSMNCIRNMYYQMVKTPLDPDIKEAPLVGIGESGTDRHERIQKAIIDMKENGYDCEYLDVAEYVKEHNLEDIIVKGKRGIETQLFNAKYNLSFLCDGIIKFKGEYYIFEFKTEASRKFVNREGVDNNHINQATAYSLSLGIDNVLFLYENRDLCTKKAFLLTVTQKMKDKLTCLICTCDEYLEMGIVPPKPADITTKVCQYCAYKSKCRKEK